MIGRGLSRSGGGYVSKERKSCQPTIFFFANLNPEIPLKCFTLSRPARPKSRERVVFCLRPTKGEDGEKERPKEPPLPPSPVKKTSSEAVRLPQIAKDKRGKVAKLTFTRLEEKRPSA